ncbi:MAG: hypothetical protein KDD25_02835 [Bdellovibrionales bacterium]|nr:hypothetical protein [Bdellovibrionales bacterium]
MRVMYSLLTIMFLLAGHRAEASIIEVLKLKARCVSVATNLDGKIESYIQLANQVDGASQKSLVAVSECESSIAKEVFSQPFGESYLESLNRVNEYAKSGPVAICDLSLALRNEWEVRYLPLLHTLYGAQYQASDVPMNLFLSALAMLAFRNASAAKAGLIQKLLYFLRFSSTTTGVTLGYKALEGTVAHVQLKTSGIQIPTDPAQILNCPGIGSNAGALETASFEELGQMIEDDLHAQFTSMGVSAALLATIRIWRAVRIARAAQAAATAAAVAGGAAATGGSILASAGPQVLLFVASIAIYKGVDYYLDRRRENKHRQQLEDSQWQLINYLGSASRIAKQLPKPEKEMTDVERKQYQKVFEDLQNRLTLAYYQARQVLENAYHLVGFYNTEMIERALEFGGDIQKLSVSYGKDLEWLMKAKEKDKRGELRDFVVSSYRVDVRSLGQSEAVWIDENKARKMIKKAENLISDFAEDVEEILADYDDCKIQNWTSDTEESYQTSIYRQAWIEQLSGSEAQTGAGNRYSRNLLKFRAAITNGVDQGTLVDEDVINSLLGIQNSIGMKLRDFAKEGGYVLNESNRIEMERRFLIRANERAQVQWHLRTSNGDFCRDPNAVLFQVSEYFDRLDKMTNVVYLKNKVEFHFLRTLALRLRADVSRNEDIANSIVSTGQGEKR